MSQILLVRHGQASWGAADYDVLSETGERQAAVAGAALASRGVTPDVVLHGAMKRQRETARLLAEAAGWSEWARFEEDSAWDEMDHQAVLDRAPKTFNGDQPSPREYQAWFQRATARWKSGEFDHEYAEPFPAFTERVRNALAELAHRLDESGTAVVVTSGGPIARLTAHLLAGDVGTHTLLAPVVVNASVTKIVVDRRGTTLVSFNDHSHLEVSGEDDLLTYR
jgi:broad specificity phosphatase PhoE